MQPTPPGPTSPSLSEKDIDIVLRENVLSPPPQEDGRRDEAHKILDDATIPMEFTVEEDTRVLRKIDLWLMPVIVMVYFLQQLD
ncbi:hypothetical protein EIP86_009207, partial [Pleurotus ostreatoroseus]